MANLSDLKIEEKQKMDLLAVSVANLFKAGIDWKLFESTLFKTRGVPTPKLPPLEHKKRNLTDWESYLKSCGIDDITKEKIEKIRDYLISIHNPNFITFEGEKFSFSINLRTDIWDTFKDEYLLFKCLESYKTS